MIDRVTITHYGLDYNEEEYDLCPECMDEFAEFIKGAKPKNLLERLTAKLKKEV